MKQYILPILILFLWVSCKDKEPLDNIQGSPTGFTVRAKLNGADYSVTEDSSKQIYNHPYTLWSTNTMFTQGTSFLEDKNPDPMFHTARYFTIQIVATSDNANSPGSNTLTNQMISVKSYSFGKLSKSSDPFVHGVVITYTDGAGKNWTSEGDQTGSSFSIISHKSTTPGVTDSGDFSYITEGNFNCKLYDGLGNAIILTDGFFRGRTVSYWY